MDESTARHSLKPIPAFASREAEAEFWDTHDLTEYFDFDHPTDFGPIDSGLREVTVHIDWETLDLAEELAAEQGMPVESLLFLWLIERREAERAKRVAEEPDRRRESA